MNAIPTRLEVNIRRDDSTAIMNIKGLGTFLAKNKIPAVVVDPEYIDAILLERAKFQGKYLVISTVDFHDGNHYGLEKLRDLPKSIFKVDGFDVLLSPRANEKENLNEMKVIDHFIKNISPLLEVRWTLGAIKRTSETVERIVKNIKDMPCKYIRTDPTIMSSLCSLEKHKAHVALIRKYSAAPIKISGNVDIDTIIEFGLDRFRYDATVEQAKKIMSMAHKYDEYVSISGPKGPEGPPGIKNETKTDSFSGISKTDVGVYPEPIPYASET